MSEPARQAAEAARRRGDPLLAALARKVPGAQSRAEIAEQIARELIRDAGLSEEENALIPEAARLFEVGKLYLDREIAGRGPLELAPADRRALDAHPEHGRAVARGAGFPDRACAWILHQRERWDGNGPAGLAGTDIPAGARVIAVAREYLDAPLLTVGTESADPQAVAVSRLLLLSGSVLDPDLAGRAVDLAS